MQSFLDQLKTDLTDGVALATLEQLVDRYFPALAGDAAAVDSVLQAGISLLQSLGILPEGAAQNAVNLQMQIRAKLPQKNDALSPQKSGALSPQKSGALSPQKSGALSPQKSSVESVRVIAEISGERPASPETVAFLRDLKRSL